MRILIVLAVLLASCAPRVGEQDNGEPPELLPTLQVTTAGDEVGFVLQVLNTTDRPIELNFRSGQSFDFVVSQGGREIWRWSDDRMFTQALRQEILEPGESLTYQATWEPAPQLSGEFEATGILTAEDRRVEQSTRFTLP